MTGGIITGAALIMVAVFAAFALSSITFTSRRWASPWRWPC